MSATRPIARLNKITDGAGRVADNRGHYPENSRRKIP